eukprot:CAMPEP_0174257482 /NCGR_PEP_ID=MMETSP0439-20130205/6609_1 /TAXON_ID=0 /ORGANISM="Stereomyxa ramosa, Strain Chinc5" /LENGTH=397 /DNA_ID=CAMNT_0015340577 /DNA_START=27 /DNA_END=1217 /DNA_ORIENTATION=-
MEESYDLYSGEEYERVPIESPVPPPYFPPSEIPSSQQHSGTSSFGARMMEKMNWKRGEGLGKHHQGMTGIIETTEKHDRAGLGFVPKEPEHKIRRKTHSINVHEHFPHEQEFRWIDATPIQPYASGMDFSSGLIVGKAYKTMEERDFYDRYCITELVKKLFEAKSKFDGIPSATFLKARRSANPYETIGSSIFQNRAAVKLANLDQMFNLVPRAPDHVLYFADICAGPGGFTEYILYRKKLKAKGFGFTLKGDCDWKLGKFNRESPTDNFEINYGRDGTGNIFISENIRCFAELIDKRTDGKGVELVTGDGGFAVETGKENFQEEQMKQLIMCQILMAFTILQKGGNFVLKVFDCFTPFTVGLICILYYHFENVCVITPYTSRPANSERYLVCKNLW